MNYIRLSVQTTGDWIFIVSRFNIDRKRFCSRRTNYCKCLVNDFSRDGLKWCFWAIAASTTLCISFVRLALSRLAIRFLFTFFCAYFYVDRTCLLITFFSIGGKLKDKKNLKPHQEIERNMFRYYLSKMFFPWHFICFEAMLYNFRQIWWNSIITFMRKRIQYKLLELSLMLINLF